MRNLTCVELEQTKALHDDSNDVDKQVINNQSTDNSKDCHLSGTTPVPLNVFLKFNKIAKLIVEEKDLIDAFTYNSEWTAFNTVLSYDKENCTISRCDPYICSNNQSNERVVYVEKFDLNNQEIFEWLKTVFEDFGSILSIRTPRYKHSNELMGFAFIEFSEKASVEMACQYFDKLCHEQTLNDLSKKSSDQIPVLSSQNNQMVSLILNNYF